MFQRLDHIAIVVSDTDEALTFYQGTLGLPLLFSEVLEEQAVRLTHLDLGNTHLQLVQPLKEDHPLSDYLRQRGEGLHHLCFQVDNVPRTIEALPEHKLASRDRTPRRGPRGRQAAFIQPETTRGVLLEITADPTGGKSDDPRRLRKAD
jgi:methylmalonyl-CoA/ethylmalonyl-CoA epimerase